MTIDATQAGQTMTCACGKSVEVPTLRGLSALDQPVEAKGQQDSRPQWTPVQGLLFAVGAAIAAVSVSVLIFVLMHKPPSVAEDPVKNNREKLDMSSMSSENIWKLWQALRYSPLSQNSNSPAWKNRQLRRQYNRYLLLSIAGCIAGTMIAGATMGIGRLRQARL